MLFADGEFQQRGADTPALQRRFDVESADFIAAQVQETLHHAVVVDEDIGDEVRP